MRCFASKMVDSLHVLSFELGRRRQYRSDLRSIFAFFFFQESLDWFIDDLSLFLELFPCMSSHCTHIVFNLCTKIVSICLQNRERGILSRHYRERILNLLTKSSTNSPFLYLSSIRVGIDILVSSINKQGIGLPKLAHELMNLTEKVWNQSKVIPFRDL